MRKNLKKNNEMRILFLIVILFCLIDWCMVRPINFRHNFGHRGYGRLRHFRRSVNSGKFVGSNLFDGSRKTCFSPEDVNLLVARKSFEIMIPKELPTGLLSDKNVTQILRYFYNGFWLFRRISDCNRRRVMEKAFYDTLGGFLRYYLVPVCRFSFYASKVELKTVRNVLFLYEKCRIFLNTNGNGWAAPIKNPITDLKCVKIEPIKLETEMDKENEDKCCLDLDLSTAPSNGMEIGDDYMIVALPKVEVEETDGTLTNIWIPFARKRTYNLKSCRSAYILVKYYRSVSRCYKNKGLPKRCFDRKFRQWIIENVKMHLSDEELYPGLGGVLNIYESTLVGDPSSGNSEDNKKSNKRSTSVDDQNPFDTDIDGEHEKRNPIDSFLYDDLTEDSNATMDIKNSALDDWLKSNNIDINITNVEDWLKSNKIDLNTTNVDDWLKNNKLDLNTTNVDDWLKSNKVYPNPENGEKVVYGRRMKCRKKKKRPTSGDDSTCKYLVFGVAEFVIMIGVIFLIWVMIWKDGWNMIFNKLPGKKGGRSAKSKASSKTDKSKKKSGKAGKKGKKGSGKKAKSAKPKKSPGKKKEKAAKPAKKGKKAKSPKSPKSPKSGKKRKPKGKK